MADTWRENAIVQAIQIIADKKIAQAGYDKTYKGVVNKILDKTIGKYEIKYQDSLIEAYATSSEIYYSEGQEVSFLVPGNDWDRMKTIVGGIESTALTYNEVQEISEKYNKTGPSAVSGKYELSSYGYEYIDITDSLGINQEIIDNYVKNGNGLVLGMNVQTSLATSQVGGEYGLVFNLRFKDSVTGAAAVRQYVVNSKDVIGNPYFVTRQTPVERLFEDVDLENLDSIQSIYVYCEKFPQDQSKTDIKDVIISNIRLNGVQVLTQDDLNGYSVHIDYSQTGNILNDETSIITLKGILKVKGKTISSDVDYYWFRQNGIILRGHEKYSNYGGDGWECLNHFANGKAVPFTNNSISFTTENGSENPVSAVDKNTRVKCVAVFDYKNTEGFGNVYNKTITTDVIIESSDKRQGVNDNKVDYYLDAGHPTLTCHIEPKEEGKIYKYYWTVVPARGKAESRESDQIKRADYLEKGKEWIRIQNYASTLAPADAEKYKGIAEYTNAKENFEQVQFAPYIYKNVYYNFPIREISDYTKVICTVVQVVRDEQGNQKENYKGSASIILYNHMQVPSTYNLNIENGTQVFQYDGKGNSPASPQLEKPIQIFPLTFTLIDDEGNEVSYDQIVNNGYVEWIIPKTNTLLISKGNDQTKKIDYNTATGTDRALAADYDIYKNIPSFSYTIVPVYDAKLTNNYIRLDIKYKDMLFSAYTDFTFPKDGDPGTNGTDLIAKITPSLSSDRLYISNKNTSLLFNDRGDQVENLKFQLYNNSRIVENISANNWVTPPKTKNGNNEDKRTGRKSYLSVSPTFGQTTKVTFANNIDQVFSGNNSIQTDKPVNIIRAQYGTGNNSGDLRYYAQIPICTNYIKVNENYRIKVKPKTGFNYVIYSSDGTSPDYDNTMPFEIIVEKLVGQYYMTEQETYTYTFAVIGNLKNGVAEDNKYTVQPKDNYNGYDLTSAIICDINTPKLNSQNKPEKDEQGNIIYINIGFIHIPIYMIINRYNNRALNSWDGNSVQIDANGKGQILTPQIAAGAKDTDNAFTGMLMGQIALNSSDDNIGKNGDIGIMGYDSGVRTVFLDAKTGKAEFGKNNQGKIIIDPDTKINNQAAALLYSNTYPLSYFLQHPNVETVGQYYKNDRNTKGLLIDLSTPQIGYGNGNFTVNSEGHLIARGGGQIAGWTLADTKLHKNNKVGMASSNETVPTDIGLKIGNDDTVAFWAGGTLNTSGTNNGKLKSANFYVTHGGYLFSKRGQVAGWDITEKSLAKSDVGMNSDPNNSNYTVSGHKSKAFFANGNNFYVTHDGYLRSISGQIANWSISTNMLTDGNVGIGRYSFNNTNPFKTKIEARIWGGSTANGINFKTSATTFNPSGLNFAVSTDGSLYSKKGKIGGWNIDINKLWAGNSNSNQEGIRINDNGSLNGKNWSITKDGNAYFKNVWGNVQAVNNKGEKDTTKVYYLTGGEITTTDAGGYSDNGPGYRLGSDGTMYVGGGSGSMDFNGSNLIVKGTIKADGGYLGNDSTGWVIDSTGIKNANGSVKIYPTEITYGDGVNSTKITVAKVESTRIQTKGGTDGGFWAFGNKGRTGTITFSQGTVLHIKAGIITGATKGQDSIVNWTDRY